MTTFSRTSPQKDHCLIFYDGRKMNITTPEFLVVAKILESPQNKTFTLRGAVFACNDIKFAGSRMDWAELSNKDPVPAGQNTVDLSLPFSPYALLGGSWEPKRKGLVWDKYTSEQFQDMALKQAQLHKARQPLIDEALRNGNCIHCYQEISEGDRKTSTIAHAKCTKEKLGVDVFETHQNSL